jgi:DNA-binding NarL/FixJ family response regulator
MSTSVSLLLPADLEIRSAQGTPASLQVVPRAVHPATPSLVLTRREQQVGLLIAAGMSNKEIARHLFISLATTKSHVHNILDKLGLQRRGQLAMRLHGPLS